MPNLFQRLFGPTKDNRGRQRTASRGTSTPARPASLSASDIKRHLAAALQDTMLHAGVLSAEYTFKVLTTVGDQTKNVLVVNLTRPLEGGLEKQAAAERLIRLIAKQRNNLNVTAVYWRVASLVESTSAATQEFAIATAAVRAQPQKHKPAPARAAATGYDRPYEERRPRFYDDEPGYQETRNDFERTRPADSDLMGLV